MPLATQGFNVGVVPVAPQFPANLGEFDSARSRRQTAEQLELYKRLANLTAEQKATQAKLALQAQQDTAELGAVEPEVAARVAKADALKRDAEIRSRVLQEASPSLVRGGVLAAEATVGKSQADLDQMGRVIEMRQRSTGEIDAVRKRFAEAANLADHDAEAAELEKIEQDYPWIGVLPEYRTQHELLREHIKSARQRALEAQKLAAAEERARIVAASAETRAVTAADANRDVANTRAAAQVTGTPKEHERETANYIRFNQLAAEATDPDDREMYLERARVAKTRMDAINRAGTGGQTLAREKLAMSARNALSAVESRSERVGKLISQAVDEVGFRTAGPAGAVLSKVPGTDARDLRATLDTIKANIGFAELNALRQQSPTGGALGQVTEKELGFLQAVLANLEQSQSPTQLRDNLARAKEEIQQSLARIKTAYAQDFGDGAQTATTTAPAFTSEAEAQDAAAAGRIKPGDKITINGQSGTWQ